MPSSRMVPNRKADPKIRFVCNRIVFNGKAQNERSNGFHTFYLGHLFPEGSFDAHFQGHRRTRTAGAGTPQTHLYDTVYDINQLHITAVGLKIRPDFIQRGFYFCFQLFTHGKILQIIGFMVNMTGFTISGDQKAIPGRVAVNSVRIC